MERIPSSRQARAMRTAISPRLAMSAERSFGMVNRPLPAGKVFDEFVGRVATRDAAVSVARMSAPAGWSEPGQAPEFDEVTLVLAGSVVVEHRDGRIEVPAGQ